MNNSLDSKTETSNVVTPVVTPVANPTPMTDSLELEAELARLGEVIGMFKPYDSQLPIADIEGTRIVKMLYQVSPKTGKKLAENSYVRVSCKHLTEEMILARISELTPYFLSYMQSIENQVVRDYHIRGLGRISTGNLSIDKIIDRLDASETSSRLSKDMIAKWFDADIAESLAELIASKLGIDENSSDDQIGKLELVLGAYKIKFESLSNPKGYINEADCESLIGVIRKASAENSLLGNRFIAKLESMSKKQDEILLSL